jgi:heme exporter protein D
VEPATHLPFIVAAYAAAGAVIGGLTAWVMLDYRAQLRTLSDLERRGVTRRTGPLRTEAAGQQVNERA